MSYLGPKVWELVPDNFKRINTLTSFKDQIKKWNPKNCPYILCKTYIQHVDFIKQHIDSCSELFSQIVQKYFVFCIQ